MPPPHLQSNSQEDLSVVLGRFHTWDALQKGAAPAGTMQDLQEISYEEAMAARRRAGRKPMQPKPAAVADNTLAAIAQAVTSQAVTSQPLQASASSPATDAKRVIAVPKSTARVDKRNASAPKTEPSRAPISKLASRKPVIVSAAPTPLPLASRQKEKRAGAIKTETRRKPVKAVAAVEHNSKQKKTPSFRDELTNSLNASAGSARRHHATANALKTAAATRPAQTLSQSDSTAPARTISVNLRLSLGEHARMRAGATAAGVNLASYIRERTLQLTPSQPQNAPGKKEKRLPAESKTAQGLSSNTSSSVEARSEGILSRMSSFWFGKRFVATA